MLKIELISGFGFAITWHKSPQHDFALIFLIFAINYKKSSIK